MLLIYLYNNKIIYIVTNVYINSSKLNYNLSNKIYIITKFNKKIPSEIFELSTFCLESMLEHARSCTTEPHPMFYILYYLL